MGITRQREQGRSYIVKVMKLLDDKFNHDEPCVTDAEIKRSIVQDEEGDLDAVLESMVKKRIIRYGNYGFGDEQMQGYSRGVNWKVLYSSLENLIRNH